MKCIVYVSEAPLTSNGVRLPVGLSGIVKASNRNKKAGITGFLCYRHGYYFQVIEGPSKDVSQLVSLISTDSRHKQFQILINKRISQRSFSDWKVNVFNFVDHGPLFDRFIASYQREIAGLNDAQKTCLQSFHDFSTALDPASTKTATQQNYQGKTLRLVAWPDFSLISQSQMAIDLCVKLTTQPCSFDRLIADDEFGTREQVVSIIEKFDTLGVLTVTSTESVATPEPSQQPDTASTIPTKKSGGFYMAIKKFLGMR